MTSPLRAGGRSPDALRPIAFELDVQPAAAGSVLIRWGGTHVLCAATFEDRAPLHRSSGGWATAEYAMLPAASRPRIKRERPSPSGRSAEIQRLIGRSLRAALDLEGLGPRTLTLDCDVLCADGGTRCAAITGGYVAATLAIRRLRAATGEPLPDPRPLAAVSVGVVEGEVRLDLEYTEDARAEVDLNYVATASGIVMAAATGLSGLIYAASGSLAYLTMAAMALAGLACAIAAQRYARQE